ncbi:MAG: peptide chain release factor N(5)-glutamine methyltransferase [Halanaerobium sp.]|nr:peptide chain release factor N(5)-glutamine methyltransferase [Halanaerobium sp.]
MAYTIGQLLELTSGHFSELGLETPRLDAEVLLADLLNLDRVHLCTEYQKPLNTREVDRYRERVIARSKGVPVAYITGMKEFMSLSLKINEDVLIPRPETELLVEEALELLKERESRGAGLKVADVGTGSGAIALSLAHYLPCLEVYGIDISAEALKIATENMHRLGIKGVTLLEGSFLEPLIQKGMTVDMVIANPPYIPAGKMEELQEEVKHEPQIALVGGEDGLAAYRSIAAQLGMVLQEDGLVLLEIGQDQADAVTGILREEGFSDIEVIHDLAGLPRLVVARS